MSFQAYLDKVEEKTGMTPKQFIAEAKEKNLTEFKDLMAWLKNDYQLGTGHARAIIHVIQHGDTFELKYTTGTHRDETGKLNLDGKNVKGKKK